MSDYIKREDVIAKFNAYFQTIIHVTTRDSLRLRLQAIFLDCNAMIEATHAADVVEVVRCGNCEYYEDGYCCFGRHVKKHFEEYCSDSDRKMYDPHEHTMTNLEWLRTAPEDDLIDFLWVFSCPPGEREKCPKDRDCRNCWRDWMKKEAER